MLKAYILACLAVASSIPLKLHSISNLSTISKSVPSFHFTKAMLLHCVYWQMHTHAIFFVFKKRYKKQQTLQCICTIHSMHPVILFIPFGHTLARQCITSSFCKKENQKCLRQLLPFRCITFGRSLLSSAPDPYTPLHLHSISHLSSKSKSAAHPCPILQFPSILQNQTSIFNIVKLNNTLSPKNKKESKGKWLAIGLQG